MPPSFPMPNSSPDHNITLTDIVVLSAIILTGSILLVLGTSKYGVGLTGDSISYIALANNILKDFSFNDISGEPFVLWPPGYSLILVLFSLTAGVDVYAVLLPINIICYVATVILLWLLVKPRLSSILFLYLVLGTAALSPAVLRIFSFAFAEVPFIPLLILFFLFLDKINGMTGYATLIAAGVVVILLSLIKYTGILLLPVLLWAVYSGLKGKKRTTALLSAGLLIPLPLTWVLVSNFFHSGTLTGYRGASASGLFELLHEAGATFLYWVFPVILAVVVMVGKFKRWNEKEVSYSGRNISDKFLLGFSLLYFIAITVMSLYEAVDDLNNRLMIPLYFTLLIPAAFYAEKTIKLISEEKWRIAIILILCLIPLAHARTNYRGITAQFNFGAGGISTDEFHNKFPKDIEKLKAVTAGKKIYTNNPAVFYYLTGMSSKSAPVIKYYNSDEVSTPRGNLEHCFNEKGEQYILILSGFLSYNHYTIEEIGRRYQILEENHAPGWVIYRIEPYGRKSR